jgi:hypothetical protein
MALDGPPKSQNPHKKPDEYRYVFEMDGSRIAEATCLVCGNDEVRLFNLGEEAGAEDE